MLDHRIPARFGVALVVLSLVLLVVGCDGSVLPGPSAIGPQPTPLIISIEPSSLDLVPGESRQLRAVTRTAPGIILPTPLAWTSSDESIASVSPTGLVTAKREGQVAIVASDYNGRGSGQAAVRVAAAR